MAVIRVANSEQDLQSEEAVRKFLNSQNIEYERWDLSVVPSEIIQQDTLSEEDKLRLLKVYDPRLQELKRKGGYIKVDVVALSSRIPDLEQKLNVFRKEHYHTEDEVRFIVDGRGIFYLHPSDDRMFEIEVHAGDFISVPAYTWHWFDLCDDRRIKAIRLFQKEDGWVPVYRESAEAVK